MSADANRRRWLVEQGRRLAGASLSARRAGMAAIAACGSGALADARTPPPTSHDPFGRVVPPLPAPALPLTGDDGQVVTWPERMRGHATAVQLMFTTCSAICPIQGALYAEVAAQVDPASCRLLSLSIDPLGDNAPALHAWLTRHGAPPHWRAAVPRMDDLDRMLDHLRGRASGVDRHTGQVYVFDRFGRLVWRTVDLPAPAHVVELLRTVAALR